MRKKKPDSDLGIPKPGIGTSRDCVRNFHRVPQASTGSAGGLRRVRSAGSTGSFCIVKSRSRPGRLYSYGPRYATGVVRKFPCGGGEGAVHSSVVASHGLSFTFSPCLMLQKKLMMNGICASPMIHAAHEIGEFHWKPLRPQMCSPARFHPWPPSYQ